MEMHIHYEPDSDSVLIPRSIDADGRLSMNAVGILKYVLSLPRDTNVSPVHLAQTLPIGSSAVRSALAVLEECGYARQEHSRRGGRFTTAWSFFYPPQSKDLWSEADEPAQEPAQEPVHVSGPADDTSSEHASPAEDPAEEQPESPVTPEEGGTIGAAPEKKKRTRAKEHTEESDRELILPIIEKISSGKRPNQEEAALFAWAVYLGHFEEVVSYETTRKGLMPRFRELAKNGASHSDLEYAVRAWLTNPACKSTTSPKAFMAFGAGELQNRQAKRSEPVSERDRLIGSGQSLVGTRYQGSADTFFEEHAAMSDEELRRNGMDDKQISEFRETVRKVQEESAHV